MASDFNNIIEEYNLRKVKMSGQLFYYIENKRNTLYFLPSKIYQNLIITARTFSLIVYPVDNIKEVIKCFMESKTLPLSKYVLSITENMNIKFAPKNLLHNINDIVNTDYIILERKALIGEYRYKIPFSDIYIRKQY